MFRKIAESLFAKVFLLISAALTGACLVLYLAVALALPESYSALSAVYTQQAVDELAAQLSDADDERASQMIAEFCAESGTVATISTEDGQVTFGEEMPAQEEAAYAISVTVELAGGKPAFLTVAESPRASQRIGDVLLTLFPPALALILAVAAAGAGVCSRMIARPVAQIAEVSKRLARLDLTWSCDEGRRDEIGMLGRNLNGMARELDRTVRELTKANESLRAEAELAERREQARRDFFAAASHELKTPLAVVQAQTEGMMMGIGSYADHDAHLPRVLAAARRMDGLVSEMLEVARLDAGADLSVSAFDAAPVVREAVERACEAACARGVRMRAGEIGPFAVCTDRRLLVLGVGAVVGNAAAHATLGTEAQVRFEGGLLTVENRCEPLPEEAVRRLGEPFFRPDPSRSTESGGTGLGLYLARRIFARLAVPFSFACEGGAFSVSVDLRPVADAAEQERVAGAAGPERPEYAADAAAPEHPATPTGARLLSDKPNATRTRTAG